MLETIEAAHISTSSCLFLCDLVMTEVMLNQQLTRTKHTLIKKVKLHQSKADLYQHIKNCKW